MRCNLLQFRISKYCTPSETNLLHTVYYDRRVLLGEPPEKSRNSHISTLGQKRVRRMSWRVTRKRLVVENSKKIELNNNRKVSFYRMTTQILHLF